MGFYSDRILPVLVDLSMRNHVLRPYRERATGAAEGRVLDIGIGSGLNLPFYGSRAEEILGLEPSRPLLARATKNAELAQRPVQLIEGFGGGHSARRPQRGHRRDDVDGVQHP